MYQVFRSILMLDMCHDYEVEGRALYKLSLQCSLPYIFEVGYVKQTENLKSR